MSKSIKIIILVASAILILAGIVVSLFFILGRDQSPPEPIEIVIDNTSEYTIVYGSGTPTGGKFAYSFKNKYGDICRSFEMLTDDTPEGNLEILMGETNRPLSATLKNAVHKDAKEGSLVWGFAYENGKLAIYANNGGSALDRALDIFSEKYFKNGVISFSSDLFEVYEYTKEEQEAELKAEEERIEAEKKAERAEKAEEYKLLIKTFSNTSFGEITENLGDAYDAPPASPTKGEHPRLLINSKTLAELKKIIDSEECSAAKNEFLILANTETDGKLPEATVHQTGRIGEHNYDYKLLGIIQAKALNYLLTEEEYYGYGAILAIKNYLLTLDIKWIHSDQCREFGYVMYITALVYDWCYPLLSDDDKHQLIAGVENLICRGVTENTVDSTYGGVKMEIGFPPSKENAINGHGTEMQLLRDYLSFAVAIFDEYPDWWEYIGGRFYEEFVPVRNVFYASGAYPQGTACYAPWRHMGDLWAAWIVTSFGADAPYDGDGAMVVRTMLAHETFGNEFFNTGDGNQQKFAGTFSYCALIASSIYDDPSLRAWSKYLGYGFSSFNYGVASITPSEMLILSSSGTETAESRYEGFKTVHYNSYFLGQMIVREAYASAESAVVLMKIGERSTSNHDHQACGSFQIYYKGLLSGDGGVYDKYGSDHHYYYHRATISHNSLLIYNPSYASTEKGWYSGGQKMAGNVQGLDNWESGAFETGKVTGVAYGNAKDKVTPTYAYLAGDITAAYHQNTVSYVGRRMLTVYTGNEDFPMIMVVYDSIESNSAEFKKTFLLQAVSEPQIEDGRVTVKGEEGKLVLLPILGAQSVTAIGGEENYKIGDRYCTPSKSVATESWGRVEISHQGQSVSEFLNFMYVTDAGTTETLTATAITGSDELSGVCGGGVCAAFYKSADRSKENMSFTSSGEGKLRYFISGVSAGTWNVSINGGNVFSVTATEDGGILCFEGESGDVSLVCGNNIIPKDSYEISYVLNGGSLDSSAPKFYTRGEVTELPTPKERNEAIFEGWYTDSSFTQPITEISATAEGKVKVYAKWRTVITADFSKSDLNASENNVSFGKITVQQNGKVGSSVKTESAAGKTFLVWTKGDNDPSLADFSNLTEMLGSENKVTFRITLAKHTGKPTFSTNFRLRGHDVGDLKSMHNTVSVFMTDDFGNVKLGNSDKVILTLTEKLTAFSVTVDFETATLTAYSESGELIDTVSFTPNAASGASTAQEWKSQLTGFVFNWYGGVSKNAESDSALRVGEITYYVGDFIKG